MRLRYSHCLLAGSFLRLLGSLSLHLSFGLGLCLLFNALAGSDSLLSSSFNLRLDSCLIVWLGLGATLLLLSHSLCDLLRSVALGLKSLKLLGINLGHIDLLCLIHLLLNLNLLHSRGSDPWLLLILDSFGLALLLHLCLSLGFGLCLRLGNLLLREAGCRVFFICSVLDGLIVGDLLISRRGKHAKTTE